MSTIATTFHAPAEATEPSILARLKQAFRALSEGFAAYQRYEQLRARGLSHAEAAAKSFDA